MKNTLLLTGMLLALAVSAFSWTSTDVQYVLDELPSGAVHQHVMMPMRDGTSLSTHFFLPSDYATHSYPVVLLRSAYNYWPDMGRYADDIVDQSDTNNFVYKNTNGYVYVIQNLRGDGDSESGTGFEPRLSDNEINDAYDSVEAIATNAWCNGRVGMYGGSGHGMAAYMGWFSKAPHLTVVAPGNTAPNLYEHWSFENGVRRWSYDWLDNRGTTTPEWPKPTLGDYYDHSQWQNILTTGTVSNDTILIHDADAWHNFFLDSTFEIFTALNDDNHGYLVMNSGTHQGDIPELNFPNPGGVRTKNYLPSFLEILDGATITNRAYLEYYVMGDARRADAEGNFWRETTSWPPIAVPTSYYMYSDGTLSMTAPSSSTDSLSYTYHPTHPVPTVGGNYSYGVDDVSGALDQNVSELTNRSDILRFETAPFAVATEITGKLEAQLYVSTDVEDTTFMVKLIDIYPAEGTNAEYHAIMRESAIMGRYWGGITHPAPMVSGNVYRLDIDMSSISLLVETNHRIAVHVTSSSDKAFEVHPNTYTQVASYASSPTANNTLYLNSQYPSQIILPLYTTNTPEIVVSTNSVTVAEDGTATFDVYMTGPAFQTVTLNVAQVSGDTDIVVASGSTLIFTPATWTTPQTVTLGAVEDSDSTDGTALIEISGSVVDTVSVTATEDDSDIGIVVSSAQITVGEGSSNTVNLMLSGAPAASVTVTVSRISGDTDLAVSGSSSFVFTSNDWNSAQSVTLAAAEDSDGANSRAVFRVWFSSTSYADITVNEADNDQTTVHTGALEVWNMQSINPAAKVTSTDAGTVATGLVADAVSGVLQLSAAGIPISSQYAMASRDYNDATLAAAITTDHYYSWIVEADGAHAVSVAGLTIRTENSSPMTAVIVSDVSGWSNPLATIASGARTTTVDLSGDSRFQNRTAPVEFRLYGYAADSAYDYLVIGDCYTAGNTDDDLVVSGSVLSQENQPEIEVASGSVTVAEGSGTTVGVRLSAAPDQTVTVQVSRTFGDTDLSVTGGSSLVFDSGNWSVWQNVTLASENDADTADDSAVFDLSGTGLLSSMIELTATDDDEVVTVIATGLLAAWDLDDVSSAAVVTSTNAYYMSTGLLYTANGGALIHSDSSEQKPTGNSLAAIDNDEATLAGAITAGNYFSWALELEAGHKITVTSVVFRTESDSPMVSALLSDASGINASAVLGSNASGLNVATLDLSANSSLENVSGSLEFRLYGYAADSAYDRLVVGNAYAAGDGDDIQIYGKIVAVDSTAEVSVSTHAVTIDEGSTSQFGVRLTQAPGGTVTVSTARVSGDTDMTVSAGANLSFNNWNWSDWQYVTLASAEDADYVTNSATFRSTLIGLDSSADIIATEVENDSPIIPIETSVSSLAVTEGSTATFNVRLTGGEPQNPETVVISRISGDTDLSVSGGASLTFNSGNWSAWQTVTLSAAEDGDEFAGSAVFLCSGDNMASAAVNVTEVDDDHGLATNTVRSVGIVDFGAKLGSGFYRGGGASYYTAHVDRENDGSLTNDFVHSWAFSETDPLSPHGLDFDTSSLSGVFYGGMTLYTSSDLGKRGMSEGHLNQNHEFYDDLNLMSLPSPRTGEMVEAYALYYWPKEGFLNGAADYPVSFDADSEIAVHISRYWAGVNAGRWLVRDGDQFYLSEETFGDSALQFDITVTNANPVVHHTHIINPGATRWAVYSPASDTNYMYEIDFDASSASFANKIFTDVTAIGFFIERQLSVTEEAHSALTLGEPISVKWNAVRATAVINRPGTASLQTEMATLGSGPDLYLAGSAVPYELWRTVYRFGVRRQFVEDMGLATYSLEQEGSMGMMRADGLAHTGQEPVTDITWYDAVAWCNALSEFEGLEPCYYTEASYSNVLRVVVNRDIVTNWNDRPTVHWNTSAGGYRLPTAAEWEQQSAAMDSGFWEYIWFPSGTTADPSTETVRTVLGQGLTAPVKSVLDFGEHPWNGSPRVTFRPARNGSEMPQTGSTPTASAWSFTSGTVLPSDAAYGSSDFYAMLTQSVGQVSLTIGLADAGHTADLGFDPWASVSTANVYSVEFGGSEIPYKLWNFVAQWAADRDYVFNYSGDMGSMGDGLGGAAYAPEEPVTEISWYDALVWCNALSEMIGLNPVYYQDAALSNPWKQANLFRLETHLGHGYPNWPGGYDTPIDTASYLPVYMDTDASGYRMALPQEWDLANVVDANSGMDAYNWTSLNSGDKTQPVATRLPNALGLYDMEGNVKELTWGDSRANISRVMHRKGSHFACGYRASNAGIDYGELPGVGRTHVGLRTLRRSGSLPTYADFVVSTSALTMAEGSTDTVSIHLAASPSSAVTVRVTRASSEPNLSVSSGSTLVFNSGNWSVDQTATLTLGQDADAVDSTGQIRISSVGFNSSFVAVTEQDDDSLTIVTVSTNVVRTGVERMGININDNYWDGAMLKKRAEVNFEGIIHRQCHKGELYTNGFVTYWGATNRMATYGWDDVYTNGATYTVLTGEGKGTTGRIVRIETKNVDLYGNGTWSDQPFFIFDQPLSLTTEGVRNMAILVEDFTRSKIGYLGVNSYWKTAGTTVITSDQAPGSFGQACASLIADSNATVRLSTHNQRQSDANGDWTIRFWARAAAGTPTLTVDGGSYVNGSSVALSNSWQQFTITLTVSGIETPTYPAGDKHLVFELISGGSGTVYLDDIELWKNGQTNPTAFMDEAVDGLRKLNPGLIRFLRMGGNTVSNAILPRIQQYGTRYSEYSMVGQYVGSDIHYAKNRISIHEQASLCEELDADPWFCLPGTIHPEEVSLFVDYLAGSTNTAGGKMRADLGHPQPWSDVFDEIHVEFGNEAWNSVASYQLGGFNGGEYWHDLIAAGKSSPSYTNNILFAAAGQNFITSMASSILGNTTNADRYAIAPYMIHNVYSNDVTSLTTDEDYFKWFLSYPLYKIYENGMPGQAAVMESTGVKYSIYEYNYHDTFGDAYTLGQRTKFNSSICHGLSIANTMLAMMKEYDITEQCFFQLHQFNSDDVRLWGNTITFREDQARYRPSFLALEAINSVLKGDLVETTQGGDNPTFHIAGDFDSASPVSKTNQVVYSYAFKDGLTNGLVLINYDLVNSQSVEMVLPGYVANNQAQLKLLTAVAFTNSNEPELSAPQVTLSESTVSGFTHNTTVSVPPFSLAVYSWVSSGSIPVLQAATHALEIIEGTTNTVAVQLSAAPLAPVDVTLAISSEVDGDFSLVGSTSMTFSTANWNVPQTAVVAVAQDALQTNGAAVLTVSAPDCQSLHIALIKLDDDIQTAAGPSGTVLIDFGSTLSSGNWNNVPSPGVGLQVTNAVDRNGFETGMGIEVTDAFEYLGTGLSATNALYPLTAQSDTFRVASTDPTGVVRITGVSTSVVCRLQIFSSFNQSYEPVATINVNGEQKTVDTYNNTDTILDFTNVVADAGGYITVTVGNNGAGIGAINLIELEYVSTFAPDAPGSLDSDNADDGVAATNRTHTFSWTMPTNVTAVSGYSYALDSDPDDTIDTTGTFSTTYSDLANGVYIFKVKAATTDDVWGASADFTLVIGTSSAPPVAPDNFIATATGSNTIDLIWSDPSDIETGFEVERSGAGLGVWSNVVSPAANAVAWSDAAVAAGESYDYRIRTLSALGTSDWSSVASVILPEESSGYYGSKTLLFDFGIPAYPSTGNWNNITSKDVGTAVNNAVDSDGAMTEIGLSITNAGDFVLDDGIVTNVLYPETAQRDFLRVSSADDTAWFQMTGLDPDVEYTFTFFSSTPDVYNPQSRYTIGTSSVVLDPELNISNTVQIANVSPDASGNLSIKLDRNGSGQGSLGVLQVDFFIPEPALILTDASQVDVGEGSTNSFHVKLSKVPAGDTTVTVARASGDTDLSIVSGSSLVFTTSNWGNYQVVTLSAAADVDTDNGTALFSCTASGWTNATVIASEVDDGQQAAGGTQTLLFDFGVGNETTAGNWNNIDSKDVGTAASNAVTSAGDITGISLTVTNGGDFVLDSGVATNVLYPLEAQRDHLRVSSVDDTAWFQMTGLDPDVEYTFTFFSSTPDVYNPQSRYTIGTNSVVLDPELNISNTVQIAGVSPDSAGELSIKLDRNGSGQGSIGVLQVDYSIPAPQGVVGSTHAITVSEGGTATFDVKLAAAPGADVTVTVARVSGDSDLTVSSGALLVFTASNWDSSQTVTVAAAQDDDQLDSIATIQCTLGGLTYTVIVAEYDDDSAGRSMSMSTPLTLEASAAVLAVDAEITLIKAVGAGNNLIGVSLEADTLADLLADQLVAGDQIIVYDAVAQEYRIVDDVSAVTVPAGGAFWLDTAEARDIVLSGAAVESKQIVLFEGLQIIANPVAKGADLQSLGLNGTARANPGLCDKVSVLVDDAYRIYGLYTDGLWYKADDKKVWREKIEADEFIEAGEGFWYDAQAPFLWRAE